MKKSVKKSATAILSLLLLFAVPFCSYSAVPEQRGNTTGNLQNDGFAVEADGWIYFFAGSSLYRTQTGKDQPEVFVKDLNSMLPDRFWGDLSVADGWIYFNTLHGSIYRISTDGGKPELFLSGKTGYYMVGVCEFMIVDDWLYYNYETSTQGSMTRTSVISRMRLDKSENQPLVGFDKKVMLWLDEVAGGYIYYSSIEPDAESFYAYRVPTSGGLPELLTAIPSSVQIADGWVYYAEGNESSSLIRARLDGSQRQVIYSQGSYISFNVAGDWIYCFITPQEKDSDDRYFMRIKTDGTDMQILLEKADMYNVSVAGDIICSSINGTYRLKDTPTGLHAEKLFPGMYE